MQITHKSQLFLKDLPKKEDVAVTFNNSKHLIANAYM